VLGVAALEQGRRHHVLEREFGCNLGFSSWKSITHASLYSNLEGLRSSQQGETSMVEFKPNNPPNS
jgi:hypothetical protein